MISDFREDVSRLDERVAVLETTVHDNYVKVTKRMGSFDTRLGSLESKVDGLVVKVDGQDRKFHARFKEWGSGWTNTMNLMMEEMKVMVLRPVLKGREYIVL